MVHTPSILFFFFPLSSILFSPVSISPIDQVHKISSFYENLSPFDSCLLDQGSVFMPELGYFTFSDKVCTSIEFELVELDFPSKKRKKKTSVN